MTPGDCTKWMERAFLHLEGSLLKSSADESPTRITEEFVRIELLNGIKAAKPKYPGSVGMEVDVPWNKNPDLLDSTKVMKGGRPRQHDIGVTDAGRIVIACEAKWLKKSDPDAIIADIWKLAMSHGAEVREKDCPRTFLLVGGMKKPFQDTLRKLRTRKLPLRWSPQGRAEVWPQPTNLCIGSLANSVAGLSALKDVLSYGSSYHRTPPDCWWNLRCSAIARAYRTIREAEWKVVLWELDYRAPCGKHQIDWANLGDHL